MRTDGMIKFGTSSNLGAKKTAQKVCLELRNVNLRRKKMAKKVLYR